MSVTRRAGLFVLIVIVLCAASPAVFAQNPSGPSAKQAQRVLKQNRLLAKKGDAGAQYNMGVLYDRGYGVKQDFAEARRWYEKAAAQHYGRAEHNLGMLYQAGKGVSRDPAKAAKWFRRGADDGQAASQNNLAVLYMKGSGVPQNTGKAAFWTARAAAAGNNAAIDNLPEITSDLPAVHVNADSVNVRDQPNREARIVHDVHSDTVLAVLARRDDWTQVLIPNSYTIGWVANYLLSDSQAPLADRSGPQDRHSGRQSEKSTRENETLPKKDDNNDASSHDLAKTPNSRIRAAEHAHKSDRASVGATADQRVKPQSNASKAAGARKRRTPSPWIVRSRVRAPSRPQSTATRKTASLDGNAARARAKSEAPSSAKPAPEDQPSPSADASGSAKPSAGTARVGVDTINVRSGPAAGSKVIGKLHRGDEVRLLDERNGWRRVQTQDDLKGWLAGYLLVITPSS